MKVSKQRPYTRRSSTLSNKNFSHFWGEAEGKDWGDYSYKALVIPHTCTHTHPLVFIKQFLFKNLGEAFKCLPQRWPRACAASGAGSHQAEA